MNTEANPKKNVRIVSFLGLGQPHIKNENGESIYYSPVKYTLDGHTSNKSRHHDVATIEAYGQENVTSLILMGTKAVYKRWFGTDQLLLNDFKALGIDIPIAFVELPDGSNDQERWEIFNQVCKHLDKDKLTLTTLDGSEHKEFESPSEIVVDITHGFRTQPFFAASAISFVESQQRRTVTEQDTMPPPIRILYGAYEKRDQKENIAPVWDMSQFLEVQAWDAAIDGLMRYGRADDLALLLNNLQEVLRKKRQAAGGKIIYPKLAEMGKTLRSFADALATARIPAVLTEFADNLTRYIEQTRQDIEEQIPPLADQLKKLQKWADGLASEKAISLESVQATLKLADIYLETERFSELSALLRENIISIWTLLNQPEAVFQPGKPGLNEQRLSYERMLTKYGKDKRFDLPVVTLMSDIIQIRNDIQHGGFNQSPNPSDSLRTNLKKQLDAQKAELTKLIENGAFDTPLQLEPVQSADKNGFLNLSNHPLNTWSEAQKAAALALGFGPLKDIEGGFPHVAPTATSQDVAELAQTLVNKILAQAPAAVYVAGEFSLTFALVSRLQKEDIKCFTTASERRAELILQPDGSTQKTSSFEFAGWREYP